MTWIDVHSHQKTQANDTVRVYSLSRDEIRNGLPEMECDWFTVGWHPWWVEEGHEPPWDAIEAHLSHPKCLGLGEIGLDRAIETSMDTQRAVFEQALRLAQKWDVSVTVLHCVRAFSDILAVFKRVSPAGSLLFHDYNGNSHITEQLLHQNAYFSVGSKISDSKTTIAKHFGAVPLDRLFLETDDSIGNNINSLYEKMALLRACSVDELRHQIAENFQKLRVGSNPTKF